MGLGAGEQSDCRRVRANCKAAAALAKEVSSYATHTHTHTHRYTRTYAQSDISIAVLVATQPYATPRLSLSVLGPLFTWWISLSINNKFALHSICKQHKSRSRDTALMQSVLHSAFCILHPADVRVFPLQSTQKAHKRCRQKPARPENPRDSNENALIRFRCCICICKSSSTCNPSELSASELRVINYQRAYKFNSRSPSRLCGQCCPADD